MLRRSTLTAAAALLLLVGEGALALAQEEEGDEPAPAAAESTAASADEGGGEAPARPSKKRRRKGKGRHAGKFAGRVVPEDQLRTAPLPRPSGNIHLISLNNPSDQAKVNIYNADGSYNLDAIDELSGVLRCRRTDVMKPMDPQLLTYLSHVYDHFGGKPLQVVSGYRNQRKQTSNHFKGTASDIRIAGVSIKEIKAFAETLDRGGMGIGIYPRSLFVHIDVRSPPSYRWTDFSPPNPDAPDKRPPRGWKRKKLQS
jgi:uncharacterized protein YcbK (DUF882 family)